jgi:hypothetical protein
MIAEVDGVIIRDFRVFWMRHRGDIEHTYTLSKRLPEDVIQKNALGLQESLRQVPHHAQHGKNMDAVKSHMNTQFLLVRGLTMEEIEAMELDTANLATEDIDRLADKRGEDEAEARSEQEEPESAIDKRCGETAD